MQPSRGLQTLLISIASLVVLVFSSLNVAAQQQNSQRKRVLLFFTHQADQPAQVIMDQAIRSTLQSGLPGSLEVYSEYLDAVRTPLEAYEPQLVFQLKNKYEGKRFDLILVVNPPAFNFLLRNRASLFQDSPIVFMLLDKRNLETLALGSNSTGIWGESNYKTNLELALALDQRVTKVVVISGMGDWDNYWRGKVQEDFRAFEPRVQFTYLVGLGVDEQKKALSALSSDTIVFFVSSTLDKSGNNYGNAEVISQIAPVSNVPVYGTSDAHLGLGIVGGRLTSFEALGTEGARLGLRILRGERPESIQPYGIPGVPMFDWRELKRWGISETKLPEGSVVRFKEPGVWEQYRGRILLTITILLLQSLFIGSLLVERRRRQQARKLLDKLNAELEQRVEDRTAALDAKSKELEVFAYSVAHDLKAPLRGIEGYSRLLMEDYAPKLDDDGQMFVETIRRSTTEMNQLIEDLLDYSRLERSELKQTRIELQPFVKSLLEQTRRESGDRQIDFVMKVNGGHVNADVNGLTQALKNYLDNAVKFTSSRENGKIEVGTEETAQACRLWVRDNGVGFDMKYHDKIFGIFQRLSRSEEYPGTGIGLAIVRKAMERMGGRAWASSEPGNGATFYLEIPK